jgi:DNA polymerase sigma
MQRRKLFLKLIDLFFFSRLRCDVNINNVTGIRNTDLLRFYAETDERVAPLGLF